MANKKNRKVELEYILNTPPTIIYQRLATPQGLSEWFADDVTLAGNVFTFMWDKDARQAELVEKQTNKMVKFKWLDTEPPSHFTFKLTRDEMTGVLSLRVIEDIHDHNEKDEIEDLWNYQVATLKRVLGA